MLRRSRHGGVRLGRKLLGLWQRALCGGRRRRGGYRRLEQQQQQPCAAGTPERAARNLAPALLRWGRSLARRLRLGWRAGGGRRMLAGAEAEVATTPKGQVAVYVGGGGGEAAQSLRYVVPVVYLNHPTFGELLREAEEEFGFQHPGVITIPCPAARFEQAAALAAAGKKAFARW
uniref:SAUR11-auxin-responsive SAUR family member n=1 Tax=Zea mays TaxID=4577 RepID=B6SUK7_MAIZE|nr:SAUR11 - auxin-responsive SAUR family member [Zea mays]